MKKTILILLVLVLCASTEVAKADFTFGTPTKLGPNINTSSEELNASISADGLSLYFISTRSGGVGGRDIWVASRATTDDDWGEPVNLGRPINTPAGEWGVSISYDGLSLYFDTRQSSTTNAVNDLWVATRATIDDDWGNPVSLGSTVNSGADDYVPSISADGLALYFTSGPGRGGYGNYDLWVTMRETTDDPWGEPVNLGLPVNSSDYDLDPGISSDGRMLFFTRGYGVGRTEIWVTRRATTDDPWGEPMKLGATINSLASQGYPNVSANGSTLFFRASLTDHRNGGDIWQAPIIPIVDFNGDGIVNAADICIMVDYWGTDEPLCDMGPMPWGDGIVDVQDMIVLSEHLFEELNDPTLIAHWALDEEEGIIAYDSTGICDAYLMGDPIWQSDAGQVGGALMFDGVDDYVLAPLGLSPADGPFSVFGWIEGKVPGQVIISQSNGANWLGADPDSGCLMTELIPPAVGRFTPQPLKSDSVITDGQWHRVGFVWDGTNRQLYVDDILVAEDTHDSLESSENGLNIGAGKMTQPGTFFFGLIDDVRIYNRAVHP